MTLLNDLRLQGALIGLLLLGLCASLLWPVGARLFELRAQSSALTPLIERHYNSLATPLPVNPSDNHRIFILAASDLAETDNLSADIQAALIDTLKTNQTRLVDLRENTSGTSVPGLEALSFTLSFEGDLQAVLTSLSKLAETPWPLLIDNLDLKAEGPTTRPDRKMRAMLKLSLWTEAPD